MGSWRDRATAAAPQAAPPAAAAPAPAAPNPAYSFAGVRSANQKLPSFTDGEFLAKITNTLTSVVPMKGTYFVAEFEIVTGTPDRPAGTQVSWVRDISDPQKWGMGSKEIKAFTRAAAGFDTDEEFHGALGEADANALCAQVMSDGTVIAGELVKVLATTRDWKNPRTQLIQQVVNLSFFPAPKA
jgi:hypothetical protein